MSSRPWIIAVAALAGGLASHAFGYAAGISGRAEIGCAECHVGSDTGTRPTVTLSGPSVVDAGTTHTFTVSISGGPGATAGFDVSVDGGTLEISNSTTEALKNGEPTHNFPGVMSSSATSYSFKVTAGSGGILTLWATGLSSNNDGSVNGDKDNQAVMTVAIGASNLPPTVAQPAAASPTTVTGTTAALTVLGADGAGESTLSYFWSGATSGGGSVSFAPNGTNAAKNTVATFTAPGSYTLIATIANPAGQAVTSLVTVAVVQTASSVEMTPNAPTVSPGGTMTFTAAAKDQFGGMMSGSAPTWSASGDGTITPGGVFTAGIQTGSATVTATLGALNGSTVVTVGSGSGGPPPAQGGAFPLSFVTPSMGAPVSGSVDVQVQATDPEGLKLVTFSVDGTDFSVSVGPTFDAHYDSMLLSNGLHLFSARAVDHAGAMAQATVSVTVNNTGMAMSGAKMGGCNVGLDRCSVALCLLLAFVRRRRGGRPAL